SKVDTEPPRFLEFEKWWGSPVLLNAEEMQSIADQLFVGNKLVSGELRSSNGLRLDLRNIKSPIICSARGVTTSPRRSRHCTGFSNSTITRTRSSKLVKRSSIACIRASAISASSSPAKQPRRGTRGRRQTGGRPSRTAD